MKSTFRRKLCFAVKSGTIFSQVKFLLFSFWKYTLMCILFNVLVCWISWSSNYISAVWAESTAEVPKLVRAGQLLSAATGIWLLYLGTTHSTLWWWTPSFTPWGLQVLYSLVGQHFFWALGTWLLYLGTSHTALWCWTPNISYLWTPVTLYLRWWTPTYTPWGLQVRYSWGDWLLHILPGDYRYAIAEVIGSFIYSLGTPGRQ
jgi:hypothetical protein